MQKLRIIAAFILCPAFNNIAFSQVASTPSLDVDSWVQSIKPDVVEKLVMPHSLAILKGFTGGDKDTGTPQFKEFDPSTCIQVSTISCTIPRDYHFSLKISKLDKIGVKSLFLVSNADAATFPHKGKVFLSFEKAKGDVALDLSEADYERMEAAKIIESAYKALKYDGVVLDVKDDLILIASVESKLKKEQVQALAIAGSHQNFIVEDSRGKGGALLHLKSHSGSYAIFKVTVASSKNELQPGTKILIESRD